MQLTFRDSPDVAFPGMLADTMYKRTVSRSVGDTAIKPGVIVAEDVDGIVVPVGTASSVISGASQHDHTLVGYPTGAAGTNKVVPMWDPKQTMSVLQRGAIWLLLATGSTLTNNQRVNVLNTAVAERGYVTQEGAAASEALPGAMTRSKPFTLADGRRIIQVELHAGNYAPAPVGG